MTDKETRRIIGRCGLGPLEFSASEMEIYHGLSAHHWGKSVATAAAGALLDYGFCSIGLSRIVALLKPGNIASRRVMEKLGMKYKKGVEQIHPGPILQGIAVLLSG